MLTLIKAALAWIAGSRSYLTLVAVAVAAAWLYAQAAIARNERDQVIGLAEQICAAAGTSLHPAGAQPSDQGRHCRSEVQRLAAFERDSHRVTAEELVRAMQDRDAKGRADLAHALRAASAASLATQNMENANAAVSQDDVVRGPWFDALNRVAGLRPPER